MAQGKDNATAWMRDMGAPEAFVAHLEATGEIDGRLWPIVWPIQVVTPAQEDTHGTEHG